MLMDQNIINIKSSMYCYFLNISNINKKEQMYHKTNDIALIVSTYNAAEKKKSWENTGFVSTI